MFVRFIRKGFSGNYAVSIKESFSFPSLGLVLVWWLENLPSEGLMCWLPMERGCRQAVQDRCFMWSVVLREISSNEVSIRKWIHERSQWPFACGQRLLQKKISFISCNLSRIMTFLYSFFYIILPTLHAPHKKGKK